MKCANGNRVWIKMIELFGDAFARGEIVLVDFERVIAERKTVLLGWYPKAVRELTGTEEAEMFGELVEAGKGYVRVVDGGEGGRRIDEVRGDR